MKDKFFISVVMSVYNSEEHLSESIESILKQTFSNFEFIIINDGSTDNSSNIIKKYQNIDKRIITIDQKNMGLTKSLNKGIQIAKGDYIARMDADDISIPERFSNFIKYCKLYEKVNIYSTPSYLLNSNKIIPSYIRRNGFNIKMLNYTNSLIHGTLIIDTQLLKKFRYDEDYRYAQEFNLYHRLIHSGYKIHYDKNNISYRLRIHENQVSNTNSEKQIELYHKTLKEFNKKIYKNNMINRILFKLMDRSKC